MNGTIDRLRHRRADLDGEGGFTLIELLIVIVILGILAAIVVFAVQNLTSQSGTAACKADYKTVQSATETYKAQVGHYPNVGDQAALTPGAAPIAGGAVAGTPGVQDLYAQQTGVDGTQVGYWLKSAPTNGNLYTVNVSQDGNGTITVTGAHVPANCP